MKKILLLLFVLVYSGSFAQSIAIHGMVAKKHTTVAGSNLLPGYAYIDLAHNYVNGPLINTSNVWTVSETADYGVYSYINTSYVGVNTALVFKYTTKTRDVVFETISSDDFFGGQNLTVTANSSGVVEITIRDVSTEAFPVQPTVGQFVRLKRLNTDVDEYTTFRISIVDATESEVYGKDYEVRYAGSVTQTRFRFQIPISDTSEIAYPQLK